MNAVLDYNKFAAAETLRWDSINASAPGQSDEHYKNQIRECDNADEQLKALQGNLASLNAKSDASVIRHGEVTAPLQVELADPATTTERRIELRAAVNVANATLKVEQDEIALLIAACNDEINIARSIAGRRVAVKNSYWKSDAADQERVRILEKTIEAINPADHNLQDKRSAAAAALADEKARRARDAKGRGRFDLEELECRLRIADAVASRIRKVMTDAQTEIEAIRKSRLTELYQE